MKGIVVVTAHSRADFLWACLHRLSIADGAKDYRYLIAIDRKHTADVQNVAYDFRNLSGLSVTIEHADHQYSGNSFNTLSAYRWAAQRTEGLVHLVEEDIFCGIGALKFHEAAHALSPTCFAVSAAADQNAPRIASDDREGVVMRTSYQSLSVSFRATILRNEVLPLATPQYFANMVETLAARFPNTAIARSQAEQDGLINRVLEERCRNGLPGMLYPVVPRAAHYGFHGYNRSGGRALTEGRIEDRGKRLLAMTAAELNERADPSYRDITPCDLDRAEPTPLVLRHAVI